MKQLLIIAILLSVGVLLGACSDEEVVQPKKNPVIVKAKKVPVFVKTMDEPAIITADISSVEDGRVVVKGTSNLPDNTQLMVTLESEALGFSAQDKANVLNHMFSAGPLGPIDGLSNGEYEVEILMPVAGVQPDSVQNVIGDQGQYLTGTLVKDSPWGQGNILEASFPYSVTNSSKNQPLSIDPAIIQSFKSRGSTLYSQLLGMKKNTQFLERGFGDPRSSEWYRSAQKLNSDCSAELQKLTVRNRVESDLFSVCIASNYLHQIGLRYAMHRATDDEISTSMKMEVEAAFLDSKK